MNEFELIGRCILLAEEALNNGCFPAGAVIADKTGKVLSEGNNSVNRNLNRINHAEINAIQQSQVNLVDSYTILYTSIEPCFMCLGAAMINKIDEIVWLVNDYWAGGITHLKPAIPYVSDSKIIFRQFDDQQLMASSANLIKRYFVGRDDICAKILGQS